MVAPKPPFLTTAEIAQLHDLMGQGLQTVQDFQDPAVTVTFRRRGDSGYTDVATVQPISIRLENQQPQETTAETTTTGICKVWEIDVRGAEPQPGDRFSWLDHTCVVDVVPPERFGYLAIQFTLLEGN